MQKQIATAEDEEALIEIEVPPAKKFERRLTKTNKRWKQYYKISKTKVYVAKRL